MSEHYSVHHQRPLAFGGRPELYPEPPEIALPPVNLERLNAPKNPGLPPAMHYSLDAALSVYKLRVPPLEYEPEPIPITQPTQADEEEEEARAYLVDPLYAFMLYIAFAMGTVLLPLPDTARYALLWTVLTAVGAALKLVDAEETPGRIQSTDLLWGFGTGLTVSVPLLLFIGPTLAEIAVELFAEMRPESVFIFLAFAAPIGEGLFFRSILQETRGSILAWGAAVFNTVVLFGPPLTDQLLPLAVAVVLFTAMTGIYTLVRVLYSTAASFVCQVMVHTMLLVIPFLLL